METIFGGWFISFIFFQRLGKNLFHFKIAFLNQSALKIRIIAEMTISPMIAIIAPAFIKSFLSTGPVLTSKALLGVPKTVQKASDAANPTDRTVILGFIPKRRTILTAIMVQIATVTVFASIFMIKLLIKKS